MARQMTGAEMVIEALKDQGVEHIFGYPGGAVLPIYDAICSARTRFATSSCVTRAGRGPCGGGLCALDREGRRAPGHVRSRRHQRDHRAHRRADGFDPAGVHHRPGPDAPDRLGRVPGVRHDRASPAIAPSTIIWSAAIEDLPRILHEAFYIASQRPSRARS